MRQNRTHLNERQPAAAGPPPMWLNMIAPVGEPMEQRARSPRAHNGEPADFAPHPVRCNLM